MRVNMRLFSVVSLMLASLFVSAARADVASGDMAMRTCGFRDAIKNYQDALKSDPNNGELMVKLARAYEGEKWFGQSVEWWEKYISMFPNGTHEMLATQRAAANHRWLGTEKFLIGDPSESSKAHLSRAIELSPGFIDAHIWLARVLESEGRFEQEKVVLAKASKLAPKDSRIISLKANVDKMIKREGAAFASVNHGISLYDRGYPSSALSVFEAAAALNPNSPAVHYWEGRILSEENRFAEAARHFDMLSNMDPGNYRFAFMQAQAQQMAGTPMKQIAFLTHAPATFDEFRAATPRELNAPCAPGK